MLIILLVLLCLIVFVPGFLRLLAACGWCLVVLGIVGLFLMCAGCEQLKPVAIPVELTHVSHLTQHRPFTSSPTNYGFDSVSVGLKWKLDPHLTVVLSEGLVLERSVTYGDGTKACGSLDGPREVFTGRVTYEIPLR